ncbi:MAG: hypothetical protein ACREQ3_23595, partial [Candidatus Binatia bacterium]
APYHLGTLGDRMTDDEILDLIERVQSNVRMIVQNATGDTDPRDDFVLDFNRELRRLLDSDLEVAEWLIPESLIRDSYGHRTLPSGQVVRMRRVPAQEFYRRAVPAIKYLDKEVRRRRAATGANSTMRNLPEDPSEIWVIHGRDQEFRRLIFDLLRAVNLRPIEFTTAVARSGSGSPVAMISSSKKSGMRQRSSR